MQVRKFYTFLPAKHCKWGAGRKPKANVSGGTRNHCTAVPNVSGGTRNHCTAVPNVSGGTRNHCTVVPNVSGGTRNHCTVVPKVPSRTLWRPVFGHAVRCIPLRANWERAFRET